MLAELYGQTPNNASAVDPMCDQSVELDTLPSDSESDVEPDTASMPIQPVPTEDMDNEI
jgi:hypothetical protein